MKTPQSNRLHKRNAPRQQIAQPKRRELARPVAAYRQRGRNHNEQASDFTAQEDWHDPTDAAETRFIQQTPGEGFLHVVTIKELKDRVAQLPERFTKQLEVVQLSRMTRKRALFPAYGMQWGSNVYLYPIEESLVETYVRPPTPAQLVEAKMFGGKWTEEGRLWRLSWTAPALKDFYLNNVLIHEIGHVNDQLEILFPCPGSGNVTGLFYGAARAQRPGLQVKLARFDFG